MSVKAVWPEVHGDFGVPVFGVDAENFDRATDLRTTGGCIEHGHLHIDLATPGLATPVEDELLLHKSGATDARTGRCGHNTRGKQEGEGGCAEGCCGTGTCACG